MAQVIFHPGLAQSFATVVKAQLEEYGRLYGFEVERVDGHHHMHLSANVLGQRLLPEATLVRRNFTFVAGEKHLLNRAYRRWIDARLQRRHRLVDYLFAFEPAKWPDNSERVLSLARDSVVELEAHPGDVREYVLLTRGIPFQSGVKRLRFQDLIHG